jgi:hypothetical protein
MVEAITPPAARITAAPASGDVAVIVTGARPVACRLSREAARALAGDLLTAAGASSGDLLTIRPGPVLHVWRDGQEVAQVALSIPAALSLLADLAQAIRGRA